MSLPLLVAGLGNLPYPFTRHSVGHILVDSLAARLGMQLSMSRDMKGLAAHKDVLIAGTPVSLTLFKPKTAMNISGPPIAHALARTNTPLHALVLLQDSISHEPCMLSRAQGTSAGGHNGVRSVKAALRTQGGFTRLRAGIGREGVQDGDAAAWVLGLLSARERAWWGEGGPGVDAVWRELEKVVRGLKA